MTPERYRRIGELYHEALERGPGQRDAFLDLACAGDEALRKEVESLIAGHEEAGSFLETPAMEVAAMSMARTEIQLDAPQSRPVQAAEPTGRPRFFWIAISIGVVVFGIQVYLPG